MISPATRRRHVAHTITYANGQPLDIWLPDNPANAPVFVYIPGGAWVMGDRRHQGHAIMSHLVSKGWICVTMNYRTAPIHRWPAPFEDVYAAWEWVVDNISRYGGGEFIAVGGASAGAHMASLLGLTGDPDATVCLYGVYSWDSKRPDHWLINRFVRTVVARGGVSRDDSPIHCIDYLQAAPSPFLVIHGDRDIVTPESGARAFVDKLSNRAEVDYLTVRGGHHGFDLFQPALTKVAVDRVDRFLARQLARRGVAA
jgi:acetyl esterase/lipase